MFFISSANEKIKYIIGTKDEIGDIDYSVLILKIEGLNEIDGAEESILKTQEKLSKDSPSDTPKDGKVVLHFKG